MKATLKDFADMFDVKPKSVQDRIYRESDTTCYTDSSCFAKGPNGNCTILNSTYPNGNCPFQKEHRKPIKRYEEDEE